MDFGERNEMVKAELIIEVTEDNQLHIGLDLLKREDWKEYEMQIANTIQESLIIMIDLLKDTGQAEEIYRKIIKDDSQRST